MLLAACAALRARGTPTGSTLGAPRGLSLLEDAGARATANADAAPSSEGGVLGEDAGAPAATADAFDCENNLRETRHHVDFATKGAERAVFTVECDFEPRAPRMPTCLNRSIHLGQGSVFASFSAQTEGTWRGGALGAGKLYTDPPMGVQAGPEDRPWLSLDWSAEGGQLRTPEFLVRGGVQIRYTIEARAQWDGRVRRWEYCDAADGDVASAELVL